MVLCHLAASSRPGSARPDAVAHGRSQGAERHLMCGLARGLARDLARDLARRGRTAAEEWGALGMVAESFFSAAPTQVDMVWPRLKAFVKPRRDHGRSCGDGTRSDRTNYYILKLLPQTKSNAA